MNMTRMIMSIVIIVIAGNVSAFKSDGPFRGDTSRTLTTADNPYNSGFKHERPLTIQDFLDTDGKGRSQNNTQALLLPTDFKDSLLKRINAVLKKKELEIRIERVETDFLGNTHVRLQQYYLQVPVVGSEMLVHINKKNTIYAVSGKIAPLLTVSNSRHLLGEKAQEIVLANFAPIKPVVKDTPSLVIFNGKFAYKLIFTGTGDEPSLWHCYIDAQTGQELFRLNSLFKGPPGSVGSHVPVSGTRLTKEDGTSVTIQGWHDTLGNYFLYHKNIKWGVYNIRNSDWEQRATNSWGTSDPAAISLAKNFETVQNWVTTVLHRNSFNNAGAFAQANVHEGTNYVNAYWDGTDFHFGDGDGSTAAPLTVLDVAAHEYGHAITQYTSNLVYSYESGALNESYSDIMGTFVEFATQPDGRSYYPSSRPGMADWLCGEDCWLSADALRDLRNPQRYSNPSYYLGTYWYTGSGDNGGVHYNSGVQNFAFYLLSEGGSGSNDGHPYNITGIGVTAAGSVAMYANMYLLISSSQYRDARPAWVLAAATLGYDTNTVKSVWTACGILPQAKNLVPDLTAINFGAVGNGSSKQVILSLSNTGLGATTISSISSSNPMFSITATLPLTVAGGQAVRLPVLFRPTSIGPQNGVITILSNADDNPTIEVSVSGIGVPPAAISVSPGSLKQLLLAGDSTIRNMTIKNTAATGSENLIFNIDIINQSSLAGTWQPALIPGDGSYKTPGWSIIDARQKPSVGLKSNPLGPIQPAASHLKILYATTILATDGVDDFVTGLRSLSNVDSVKVLSCATATPNLAYLRGYDIVLTASQNAWANSILMGDVLADYADAGGKICILNAAMCSGGGWTLSGRIMTPAYSPLAAMTYVTGSATSASFVAHPITNNITSITAGLYSTQSTLQGNGVSLGRYNNGYHIAAYNPVLPVVSFNVFVLSSYWGGDFIRMMGNTFDYLSGSPWLSIAVKADTLSPGDSAVIPVKFNAKGMLGGSYSQVLSITHNATNNSSPLSVPCTLVVDGVRRLAAIPSTLNFGNAWVGVRDTLFLTLKNAGDEATVVSSITSNNAEFYSDAQTPLTVRALDSIKVRVILLPVSLGSKSGVLTITSNAEDNPIISVQLIGQAVQPPTITVNPSILNVTVRSGDTAIRPVVISNNGGDSLRWTASSSGSGNFLSRRIKDTIPGTQVKSYTCLHDLTTTYWTDGGNDAFDGFGYPSIIVNGTTQNLCMLEGDSLYTVSGYRVRVRNDFAENHIYRMVLEPDAGQPQQQRVTVNLYGDMGSDGSEVNYFDSVAIGGKNIRYYVNEVSFPNSDPRVVFMIVPSRATDLDSVRYWKPSSGNVSMEARSVILPAVVYIIPSYHNLSNIKLWFQKDLQSQASWMSFAPSADTIANGQQTEMVFKLNAQGLLGGVYRDTMKILHNAYNAPNPFVLPVTMTVTGVKRLSVAPASLSFGPVWIGSNKTLFLDLTNSGTDTTTVQSLVSTNSEFTVAVTVPLKIAPQATRRINAVYTPAAIESDTGSFLIQSDAYDNPSLRVQSTGTGILGPNISVSPASFKRQLQPADSVSDTLTISNTGGDTLSYTITVSNNAPVSRAGIDILAWVPYTDMSSTGEYVNTVNAIDRFTDNQTVTNSITMIADTLRIQLQDKEVFLIMEMENGTVPAGVGTQFKPVLEDFCRRGGTIIYMCPGLNNNSVQFLTETGLMALTMNGYVQSGAITITQPAHPIFAGVTGSLAMQNATCYYTVNDTSRVLATYNGYMVIAEKRIYNGRIITLGPDFFAFDDNWAHIISNAVQMSPPSPVWLSVTAASGKVLPGLNAKITVKMNATALITGQYTGRLDITHNVAGQNNILVPCTLTVTSLKRLTAQPASLNFGTVVVGRDSLLTLTLLNNGNDTTTVSNITSTNGLFTIVNTLPVKVAPFGTVPVQIRFRPTTVSTQTGVLTITSNAADNPAITVSVNGQGILGPQITVTPGYLKRQLSIGDSIADTLNIGNPGDRNLTYSITVFPNSPYTWIRSVLGSGTVLPGQNTKAPVIMNTRQVPSGLYIGRIEIANNVVGQSPKIVPCTLTVLSQKRLSVTPLSVNFGTVLIGRDSLVSLTLQNTGNDTTTVTSINSSNSVFSHTSVLPVKVPPFSSRILQVRFRPTAAVSESGILTLLSNASDNPTITVSLQGTGALPAVMNISPLKFVESLRAGDTLTRVLNIGNTGGLPLQFSIVENVAIQQDMTSVYGPEHFIVLEKGAPDFRVGLEVPTGSGGPDAFGYRWKDSDDPSGPVYTWQDIKATGSLLSTVSNCDDCYESRNISFPFPFYGNSYSTIYVSSNGYVTFGAGNSSYSNYPLPSTSMAANLIAAFYDDLSTSGTGDVYFQDFGDRVVVQFDRVPPLGGGGEFTFQIVIRVNGTINIYYSTITGAASGCTVGIQNSTQNIGLNIAYNATYIKNNLAVEIRTAPKWLSISPTTGTVNPGASLNATAKFDARTLMGGSYRGQFAITHNDPSKPVPFIVPCTLNVTGMKRLAASPAQINFGSVWIGSQKRATVTLTNSGSDTTTVQTISSTNSRFTHTAILPLRLGPQRTSQFEAIYSPTQIASDIGTLVIQSNAEDNPAISISMSGNGTNPPLADLTPTSLVYNLTPRDAPADQTCVLRNIGGDILSYRVSITQVSSPVAGAGGNPVIVIAPRIYENLIYNEENYSHPFVEGRLIVGLKEQKSQFANTAVLSQVGVEEVKELAIARDPKTKLLAYQGRKPLLLILKNKTKEDVIAAIKTLRTDENVAYAEPDYIVHALGIPNDPYFNQLYGMNNTGQNGGTIDADIDAPEAWDRHTGNKQILIGVIDTGIDYLHPDLVANMWHNPGEIPGNGIDDDGNGFIDDVYGYNFVGSNSSDPRDDHYHGTHCAGTIAGVGNNGVGVAGVMWNASLVAIKFLDSGGSGTTADAIEAVNYATAMHVLITSNSWGGGGFSQALMDAIAAGGLFVAAAGNSSSDNDVTPQYPATYPLNNIIAVAATDRNDLMASFSCYGRTTVDLGAPGVDIYSCQPPNLYQNLSGTSMATPHVAGSAGLVWTYNTSQTALEVKQKLLAGVDPIASLNGRVLTGGRLNVQKALALAGPAWLTVSPMNSDSLVAGASRTFTARVTPAGLKAGSWVADITYQTNEPVNPVHTVGVTANIGTCRSLTAEKDTLQFGRIIIGNTTEHKIALRNICNDTVTVSAVTYTSPVFRTVSTLPVKIGPNGAFDLRLAFTPAAQQLYNETMTIQSNADDNPAIPVRLYGEGAIPPVMNVNPLKFVESVRVGDTLTRVLNISNTGGLPLQFSIVEIAPIQQDMTTVYGPEHFIVLEKGAPDFRVGLEVPTGSGGPDAFGYRWKDSDDPSGPAFVWQDIKTTGSLLSTVSSCDDCYESRNISFPFPFYGNSFSTIYVSSNGYITFGSGSSTYSNYPLPSTSMPPNLVAAFYDDLDGAIGGDVYFQDFGDRVVVQFEQIAFHTGSGNLTFQIILYRDGKIYYYYKTMSGTLTSATTGIQNSTQNIGLNIAYNATYIKNNLAVEIRTAPKWLSISPTTGTVNPGASLNAIAKFDARGLMGGTYRGQFAITHNDPSKPVPFNVPCTLTVVGIKRLAASPVQINFGSVWIGAQKRATVTLTNSGSDTTTVQTISSTNSRFTHTAILPLRLGPQRTSQFEAIYSPTQAASDTGTLVIQSNADDNPVISIRMSGQGITPPLISLNPVSFTKRMRTNQNSSEGLFISNTGGDNLTYTINAGGAGGCIVINEFCNEPDFIELWNRGTDQNMSGWILRWNDNTGTSGIFNFPSGYVFRHGKRIVLRKNAGTPNDSTFYYGSNIGWFVNSVVSIALIDNLNNGIDFVRTLGSSDTPPSGTGWIGTGVSFTLYDAARNKNNDTDGPSDWSSSNTPTEFRLNPGQDTSGFWPRWLSVSKTSGTVIPLYIDTVRLLFNTNTIAEGTYIASLFVNHNGTNHVSPWTVPLTLTVTNSGFVYKKAIVQIGASTLVKAKGAYYSLQRLEVGNPVGGKIKGKQYQLKLE